MRYLSWDVFGLYGLQSLQHEVDLGSPCDMTPSNPTLMLSLLPPGEAPLLSELTSTGS